MDLKRVILGGLIASVVMGMLTMLFEGVAGVGFWAPVVFIAATLVRDLQTVAAPVPFLALPVILGLMGHMMNSVILGVVFALATGARLRGAIALAVAGAIYGGLVFGVMWGAVVPLVDPVMLRLNPAAFAVAHVMWGGALGLALGWGHTTSPLEARPSPVH